MQWGPLVPGTCDAAVCWDDRRPRPRETQITRTAVDLVTPDGPMPVFVAMPDGEPRGGVIVIQEAFGITDHIADVTDRYAAAGYLAIAPALYHREGAPVLPYGDHMATIPLMMALTEEGQSTDVTAMSATSRSTASRRPRPRSSGFCLGGSTAMLAAVEHKMGAAVSYYGGGRGGILKGTLGLPPLVELAPKMQTPWLGLYGDLDAGLPPDDVEQLREAAAKAPVPTELIPLPRRGPRLQPRRREDVPRGFGEGRAAARVRVPRHPPLWSTAGAGDAARIGSRTAG